MIPMKTPQDDSRVFKNQMKAAQPIIVHLRWLGSGGFPNKWPSSPIATALAGTVVGQKKHQLKAPLF